VKKVETLEPKGKESDYVGYRYSIMSKRSIPGLKMTPKTITLFINSELGKPYVFLKGRDFVRMIDDTDGRGNSKKQRTGCNGLYMNMCSI
jgi:hypothetical protein